MAFPLAFSPELEASQIQANNEKRALQVEVEALKRLLARTISEARPVPGYKGNANLLLSPHISEMTVQDVTNAQALLQTLTLTLTLTLIECTGLASNTNWADRATLDFPSPRAQPKPPIAP